MNVLKDIIEVCNRVKALPLSDKALVLRAVSTESNGLKPATEGLEMVFRMAEDLGVPVYLSKEVPDVGDGILMIPRPKLSLGGDHASVTLTGR